MLCDDCGRNEAVVHITQIGPNGRVEKNLCETCAARYGQFMISGRQNKDVSMDDFLKGIFSSNTRRAAAPAGKELTCPNCGMSYKDFEQTGKIGCSVCYETFRGQLEPLLRRIHGSNVHRGKIPRRSGGKLALKQTIETLRAKLRESIEQEAYEKAAQYRDRIRELEGQMQQEKGGEGDVR